MLARILSIRALLDVEDLAAEGQHRLGRAVPCLLRRAARRIALDDEDLGVARVLDGAVRELPGQGRVLERRLAAGQVARLPSRVAGARGVDRLADDSPRVGGVLLEELAELAIDGLLDEALDRRVAELGLRLALELRLGELHRDDRGEALAHVLAREVRILLLEQALLAGIGVDRAGQGRAEPREVRAALVGVDVVGEREHGLLVGGVPLHRDLDRAVARSRSRGRRSCGAARPCSRSGGGRSRRCRPRSGTSRSRRRRARRPGRSSGPG